MGNESPDKTPGRSVTGKALSILGAFTPARPELRLVEISRITGLPEPTAHRLAGELVAWGALERLRDGTYRIGLRLWEVGSLSPRSRTLREIARPFMQDLYEVTRENVHLAVLRDSQVLYVEKYFGPRSIRVPTHIGERLPLHSTGAGKVLLAFSPPALQDRVLHGALRRFTPATIVMPGTLSRALVNVRRTGMATCVEELTMGALSVAAPIYDANRTVVAALSLVMRSSGGHPDRMGPAVRTAAQGISRELARCPVPLGGTA
ncbi:DNA-binding IclR family transcriptional regulator [Thermocatellispora tengchongensis]|uniref:DNA-binding IclR family transcriptional regulator n=1 Tax=Thermocatellispora tengchongensis TaxID=1073253 RepID=A0A840P859_9ACTN|nr:IclR family transcriptional regulator [Thermocatellispora tengchongensis]MBB5133620.1 DNA-binding IclR family transcriptional regulator [Thermocatellispora tengchongensis]